MAKTSIIIPCPWCAAWAQYFMLYFGRRNCSECSGTHKIKYNFIVRDKGKNENNRD